MVAVARERPSLPCVKGGARRAEGLTYSRRSPNQDNPSVASRQLPLHKGAFGARPIPMEPTYITARNDLLQKTAVIAGLLRSGNLFPFRMIRSAIWHERSKNLKRRK